MPPSENNMAISANDNVIIDDGDTNRRKSDTKKSFDLEAFHQLRLERLENQRKAERQRVHRDDQNQRSQLRWNSAGSLPPSTINSPMNTIQRRSPETSSSGPPEKNTVAAKLSARQELLRLGRRYASFSSSTQQRGLSSSESIGVLDDVSENFQSQQALISPLPNDGSVNQVSGFGGSSVVSENEHVHGSNHHLDADSRSFSTPPETMSLHDNAIPLVTPDERPSLREDLGIYGSQYLLLARANSSPAPLPKHEKLDSAENKIVDADDVSSSASYSTPTPHLQAASACNSHGENEDGCEDHQHRHEQEDEIVDRETDHFLSLCKAQVLISEMEQGKQGDNMKDTTSEDIVQTKTCNRRLTCYAVEVTLVTIAGAAIGFFWYKVTFPEMYPGMHFSAQLRSWWQSVAMLIELIQNALHSKMNDGMARFSLLQASCVYQIMQWINHLWTTTTAIHSEFVKDVDVLSWVIDKVYRLEKVYYDAHQYFTAAEFKSNLSEVQAASTVVLNITVTVAASCWQQMKSAPLKNLFSKSDEEIVITKSALTSPLIFSSGDGYHARTLENETLAALDEEDEHEAISNTSQPHFLRTPASALPTLDVEDGHESTSKTSHPHFLRTPVSALSALDEEDGNHESTTKTSQPNFWRTPASGTPFIRQQLPSLRKDIRFIHSIPSFGTQSEPSVSSTSYWQISTGPSLTGIQHHEEQSRKYLLPLVGLSHSRLSINSNLRLDSMAISSDIRKNIAAMIMEKYKPPDQNIQQQPSQLVAKKERNYYKSSYPTEKEQGLEKDEFEDVDVMSIASEFVGKLLQRRSRNKKRQKKRKNV